MNIQTIILFGVAVALTFVLHEGGHWAAGEMLGYDMFLRANSAGSVSGGYSSERDAMIIIAAGPVVTVLQGLLAFGSVRAWGSAAAFPFLLSSFMMRALAAGISLSKPNDEARLSVWFGFGEWAVFGVVLAFLFLLVVLAARRLAMSWSSIALGVVAWTVFASALILSERYLPAYVPGAA